MHTTGGYLVYASMTHEYVFDYHDGDIYWCTADVGWVTRTFLHRLRTARELRDDADVRRGATFPDQGRFWEVVGSTR